MYALRVPITTENFWITALRCNGVTPIYSDTSANEDNSFRNRIY